MTLSLREQLSARRPKRRILAIDGGGVRGMLTLGVLAALEETLRQRSGKADYRLSSYFDLIGGTSTGSIIATGLALGMRVVDLWALYETVCPAVFNRERAHGLLAPKFSSGPLAKALTAEFGAETLGSEKLKTGLAIHAKRMDSASAWIVVNNPAWVYYDASEGERNEIPNSAFELRSLVQASAAAPHYFSGVPLKIMGGKRACDALFVDGGVGGHNNPAFDMLMSVRDPAYGFNWALGPDNLYLLSLGTGFVRDRRPYRPFSLRPFFLKTVDALRGMINDVSLQQIAHLQALSESQERWWINGEKKDQPAAPYLTRDGNPAFHYQRMDVRFESETLPADKGGALRPETVEALLGRKISAGEFRRLCSITEVQGRHLGFLSEIGKRAGAHYMKIAAPPAKFDPESW